MKLQQIRSGAIQISNQIDGTKSSDGNKVSGHNQYQYKIHFKLFIFLFDTDWYAKCQWR